MSESLAAAGKVLSASLTCSSGGDVSIYISTDNAQVVRDLCITAVTLGALYAGYKLITRKIDGAVNKGLGGDRDDQEIRGIRPGSLHVLLHCFTDKRFLEVVAEYETGRMKERLQYEFTQAGIRVEGLKVEIENMEEVNKIKEAISKRDEESNCKNEGSSSDTETSVQGGSTITTSNRSLLAVDKTDGKTSKSLLHEYAQKRGAKPPEYDEIPGSEKGFRSMVKIMDKTFKCVEPCSSKKNSREMAAKEAMKYFNELSTENSSKTSTDISAAAALDCGKIESENASSLAEVKENLIDCEVPSSTSLPISSVTNKAYVFTSATSNEKSLAEAVKPSETKVTDSTDEKQTPTLTQKTQPNSKNALQEYVQKRKLEELRYVSTQDPTTKEFLSKVFLGKRCFKGKLRKSKAKEAEKHVAEIALNILEGRSGTADGNCKELLKSYHKELDLPMFPKFEDDTCKDDGRFKVCVKVLKKYKIVCNDVQPNKKKTETWLAEQAVKVLEEEERMIPDPAHENAKSVLNRFLQSQGSTSTLKYEVQGDQKAGFSGCLYFCAVNDYECLAPQPSKEEAITSAAMSACNGLDLV